MKRQLLMMTQFKFDDEPHPHSFELWRDDKRFSLEDWLVVDNNDSTLVMQRYRNAELIKATESYGRFVNKYAMTRPGAGWLGVAITKKIFLRDNQYLFRIAHKIVIDALLAGISTCPGETEVLIRIFPAEFLTNLPRGMIGIGCWKVQLEGYKVCQECSYSCQPLCAGIPIIETGINSVGVTIPII